MLEDPEVVERAAAAQEEARAEPLELRTPEAGVEGLTQWAVL